jgi:elongation factor 2
MEHPDFIRNISVIAHVDHGKTTLTDSLIAKAGIISEESAGKKRYMTTDKEGQERGITIKSTGVSLLYEVNGQEYLINLIDSPGHVDFSSEVTAALRVTDGALVVVDCVEGVCVQTETVLRQALSERIKPILFINKVDRNMLELQLDPEEMYQSFCRTIEKTNAIISTYDSGVMGDMMLEPGSGNVGFGSGLMGWGFTLAQFARMYSEKFGVSEEVMRTRLWGENYYDAEAKKWKKSAVSDSGKPLTRGFCSHVISPLQRLSSAVMSKDTDRIQKATTHLGIPIRPEDFELPSKDLLKKLMQEWLNAADCLLEMITTHLPSPKQAGAYRTEILYEGPLDDDCATAMRTCDPRGPLMMYVSKMIPTSDYSRFFAFGRVFSGTIGTGQRVRIMGPNFKPGLREDLYEKAIQKTVLMMGRTIETISDVPAGNTVGLVGIDQYLTKSGTISDHPQAHNIRTMKYSVSPVVRVAVTAKNAADLPKLVEGLRKLSKSDQLVQCTSSENGENIIAGCGELHVEICLHDLEEEFARVEILKSDPIVTYKETITTESSQVCLAKSANKLNRLFCTAQPLGSDLVTDIESGKVGPGHDIREQAHYLSEVYNWDLNEAKKLWSFGPDSKGTNVLIDKTVGVQYLQEAKDSIDTGFQMAAREGVLCGEELRGVRFNIVDVMLHSDSVHRGGGQLIPAARRVFQACERAAGPTLEEPMFLVDIQAPADSIGGVYQTLAARRAIVQAEETISGTPLMQIKAYLPVAESFGFNAQLRANTSGKAFPQCVFHHWEVLTGDLTDPRSKTAEVVRAIRVRKGMQAEVAPIDQLVDKL